MCTSPLRAYLVSGGSAVLSGTDRCPWRSAARGARAEGRFEVRLRDRADARRRRSRVAVAVDGGAHGRLVADRGEPLEEVGGDGGLHGLDVPGRGVVGG